MEFLKILYPFPSPPLVCYSFLRFLTIIPRHWKGTITFRRQRLVLATQPHHGGGKGDEPFLCRQAFEILHAGSQKIFRPVER